MKYITCPNPHCEEDLVLALIWEDSKVIEYRAICEGTRHGYSDYRGGCGGTYYVTFDKLTGEYSSPQMKVVEPKTMNSGWN